MHVYIRSPLSASPRSPGIPSHAQARMLKKAAVDVGSGKTAALKVPPKHMTSSRESLTSPKTPKSPGLSNGKIANGSTRQNRLSSKDSVLSDEVFDSHSRRQSTDSLN